VTGPWRGDALSEAARLVAAQPGAVARLRARHVAREDGRCQACGPTTPWPCVHITIARRAEALAPHIPPPGLRPVP
jgi:hypothetical protein